MCRRATRCRNAMMRHVGIWQDCILYIRWHRGLDFTRPSRLCARSLSETFHGIF
jgi:hypothetical protein